MRTRKRKAESGRLDAVLAEAKLNREKRSVMYRDMALKLFPHICARCGREFSGKRIRELTVHHKDHDHENNPPDGSNWELLCIYCHDMEHQRYLEEGEYEEDRLGAVQRDPSSAYKPFAGLKELLEKKK